MHYYGPKLLFVQQYYTKLKNKSMNKLVNTNCHYALTCAISYYAIQNWVGFLAIKLIIIFFLVDYGLLYLLSCANAYPHAAKLFVGDLIFSFFFLKRSQQVCKIRELCGI